MSIAKAPGSEEVRSEELEVTGGAGTAQALGRGGVMTGIGEISAICGQVFLSTDFADYADGRHRR